ncbi:MAG: metal-dependent hydrolase [Verrucomicrobiota bacterium]
MKLTYFGHSCVQIEISDQTLLIDPFISPNEKASTIKIDQLMPDVLLLTHGHQDHIADAISIAKQSNAQVVAAFEVANWVGSQGIEKVQPINHGGLIQLPFGSVKAVNAIHSSSLPDGSYGGNPLGYVINYSEGTFYHSGDTALTYDMKLIGELYDLRGAALCIGDTFTMGPNDAVLAAEFIQCKKIVGIHYDTFPPIEIDHASAKKLFAEKGIELVLLDIGESLNL